MFCVCNFTSKLLSSLIFFFHVFLNFFSPLFFCAYLSVCVCVFVFLCNSVCLLLISIISNFGTVLYHWIGLQLLQTVVQRPFVYCYCARVVLLLANVTVAKFDIFLVLYYHYYCQFFFFFFICTGSRCVTFLAIVQFIYNSSGFST